MDLETRKRELRSAVRARMPEAESFAAASLAAQERLAASPLAARARVVALYRALPSECGTSSLAAALQTAGKEICYPCVMPGQRELTFRRGAAFAAGALGVEEPTGALVSLAEIDLLVVPAIAVDSRGHRLGRGKGHYDATLAAFSGPSVALVFEAQLVPEVPVGEHDHPVAAVCTEARLITV